MKKLLIANFKSNKSVLESKHWLDELKQAVDWKMLGNFEVAVAPSFIAIESFSQELSVTSIPVHLATQDLSSYPSGSYTGAVSTQNIADLNIRYAILGHSERRRYFKETSEMVAQKVTQALAVGITPLVCIDEEYLEEQIRLLDSTALQSCIFVYEPLSAIGTGNSVKVSQVTEVFSEITKLCGAVPCLYGGSVTDQNVSEYLLVSQGVLVGSFSLKAQDFAQLVATATAV